MQTIRKYKMPLIIIGVLILAFVIYSFWHGGSSNNGAVLTASSPAANNPQVGQAFVNQLLTLQGVRLNSEIFSNPSFNTLQDFSQPVPTEPQGRPNPFAPIGVDTENGPTINQPSGPNYSNLNFSTTPAATSSRGR
ncbi:MAG TPA: hypothetical protein VFA52_00210 [Candidatus Paceibacterota bacterium]|nr:hypothetical protein [Candidatus Paceibacterota bacterium]